MILAAVSPLGPRVHSVARAPMLLASSRLSYFRSKTDVRRREDPREIRARVKARRNDADRHARRLAGPDVREAHEERGWNTSGTRENERHPRRWDHTRRSRHLLDTAWACRVPWTRGTQHCTLLGAVPRRVVPPPARATLWSERIACDSNRHRQTPWAPT